MSVSGKWVETPCRDRPRPPITSGVMALATSGGHNAAMDLPADPQQAPAQFGSLLRECRLGRRLSQLDLSLHADVSQRHLSFLESGRAKPSREMVVSLAEALDLPLAVRNRLLQAAGFAGIYPRRQLDADAMHPIRNALERMLAAHEPFPAVVVDRAWNVVMVNRAVASLFDLIGGMQTLAERVGGANMLRITLHPEGMRPFIQNFAEFAAHLLARSAHEALDHPELNDILKQVLRYPDLPLKGRQVDTSSPLMPILPMQLKVGEAELNLFSTIACFGTPLDVTADELRIEHLFPVDEASEALLSQMSQLGT